MDREPGPGAALGRWLGLFPFILVFSHNRGRMAGPKGARPLPTDPMGVLSPCRAHRPAPVAGRVLTGARIGRFAL